MTSKELYGRWIDALLRADREKAIEAAGQLYILIEVDQDRPDWLPHEEASFFAWCDVMGVWSHGYVAAGF